MTRRRLFHYLIAAPVGFALAAMLALAWQTWGPQERPPPAVVLADRPLPAMDLPGLADGAAGLTSADFEDRLTVLNLFASWCVPCLAEHPYISRLSEDGGLQVVGIAWMDDPAATAAWLAEHGNPYDLIGADRTGALQPALGIKGVPSTFIVDPGGRIRYVREGPLVGDLAIADFEAALADSRR